MLHSFQRTRLRPSFFQLRFVAVVEQSRWRCQVRSLRSRCAVRRCPERLPQGLRTGKRSEILAGTRRSRSLFASHCSSRGSSCKANAGGASASLSGTKSGRRAQLQTWPGSGLIYGLVDLRSRRQFCKQEAAGCIEQKGEISILMRRSLIASPSPPLPAKGRKGLAGHCLLGAGRGWRQRPFSRRPRAAAAPRPNWRLPRTAGSTGTESWAAGAGLQPCALGCMLLLPGGAGRQAPQPAGAVCMEKSGCSPFPMCWAKGKRDLRYLPFSL